MFSTWDLVRPPMWHPMSVLELSLMDDDELLQPLSMLSAAPLSTMMTLPTTTADEEFFKDLPIGQAAAQEQQQRAGMPEDERQRAFSSYSFSQSTVHDAQGRTVGSTRRRYEDSSGRLKAVHEREVDGRRLVTIWSKKDREDEGEHRAIASEGSTEEFEKIWADTPFGKAHAQKQQQLEHEQEQHQQHKQHKQEKQQRKLHKQQQQEQQHKLGASGAKTETASPATAAEPQQQQAKDVPMTSEP